LVFVTAYDQYAVQAFAQGVLDYLVKPVEPSRLEATVSRLQERLRASQPASNTDALLHQLAASLQKGASPAPLRWLRASVGQTVRLISVDDIDFPALRRKVHDHCVAGRHAATARSGRAHATQGSVGAARRRAVRTSASLGGREPARDQSRHARCERTADIHLKGREEVLPVSRSYLHLFRQM
jgi:DNA-binding LytR/AlgR family response regulator